MILHILYPISVLFRSGSAHTTLATAFQMFACVVLALLIAYASGKPSLTLEGDSARVDLYAAWSRDALDCFGSTCAEERVYNLFLDAPPPGGVSLCEWAAEIVTSGECVCAAPSTKMRAPAHTRIFLASAVRAGGVCAACVRVLCVF